MAEEWKELLLTVPDTLLEAGTARETFKLIRLALRKLTARVELLRRIRLGVTIAVATGGFVDPDPVGVCPSEVLHDACREIHRRSSIKCRADHVLRLCCEQMGILPSGENSRSWEEHKHAALDHADNAQKGLRNAASSAKAAQHAIGIAGSLPEGSPLSKEWILAAKQLLDGAINETDLAVDQVHEMGRAISLEFFDAWKITRS